MADVQRAADLFRPLYDQFGRRRRLRQPGGQPAPGPRHRRHHRRGPAAVGQLDRPNVFIKVPATREGVPAIRQLISEGINVNVTLLFGLPRYREVAEAYISGLEERAAQGQDLERRLGGQLLPEPHRRAGGPASWSNWPSPVAPGRGRGRLIGEVAIASAKVAYSIYQQIFGSSRFQTLAAKGARAQRLLWASTSTKNPAYTDVKYVEPLIGPETINTMPLETVKAYRDHGDPAPRLADGPGEGRRRPAAPAGVGYRPQPGDPAVGRRRGGEIQPALRQPDVHPGGQAPGGPGALEITDEIGPVGRRIMNITTLFLDIGNVLLTNGWDRQMRQAGRGEVQPGLRGDERAPPPHLRHLRGRQAEPGRIPDPPGLLRGPALHPGRFQGLHVRPVPAEAGDGPNSRN